MRATRAAPPRAARRGPAPRAGRRPGRAVGRAALRLAALRPQPATTSLTSIPASRPTASSSAGVNFRRLDLPADRRAGVPARAARTGARAAGRRGGGDGRASSRSAAARRATTSGPRATRRAASTRRSTDVGPGYFSTMRIAARRRTRFRRHATRRSRRRSAIVNETFAAKLGGRARRSSGTRFTREATPSGPREELRDRRRGQELDLCGSEGRRGAGRVPRRHAVDAAGLTCGLVVRSSLPAADR